MQDYPPPPLQQSPFGIPPIQRPHSSPPSPNVSDFGYDLAANPPNAVTLPFSHRLHKVPSFPIPATSASSVQSASTAKPTFQLTSCARIQPNLESTFAPEVGTGFRTYQSRPVYLSSTHWCLPPDRSSVSLFGGGGGEEEDEPAAAPSIALVLRPFCENDFDIPTVPLGDSSVVLRCGECRAYVSPNWILQEDTGTGTGIGAASPTMNVICGVCQGVVPLQTPGMEKYFRRRREEFPELMNYTVDFVATEDYMTRAPVPLALLFVLDFRMGEQWMRCISEEIRRNVEGLSERTMVGFLGFSREQLHWFDLRIEEDARIRWFVQGELDADFVPLHHERVLVQMWEGRRNVMRVLEALENGKISSDSVVADVDGGAALTNCLGAALNAAGNVLGKVGGKLLIFTAGLASVGPHALTNREIFQKDAERPAMAPDKAYGRFSEIFNKDQISVDVFALTDGYVDMASLAVLARRTGGSVWRLPGFDEEGEALLRTAIRRRMSKRLALEAVMRLRCGGGISVKKLYGGAVTRKRGLITFPSLDPDKSLSFQLRYPEEPITSATVGFQAAILYTTREGRRRIRVHNITLPVATSLSQILPSIHIQSLAVHLGKMAAYELVGRASPPAVSRVISPLAKLLSTSESFLTGGGYMGSGGFGFARQGPCLPSCLSHLPATLFGLCQRPLFCPLDPLDARIADAMHLLMFNAPDLSHLVPLVFDLQRSDVVPMQLTKSPLDANGAYLAYTWKAVYVFFGRRFLKKKVPGYDEVSGLIEESNSSSLSWKPDESSPESQDRPLIAKTFVTAMRMISLLRGDVSPVPIVRISLDSPRRLHAVFNRLFIEDQVCEATMSSARFIESVLAAGGYS